VGDYIIDLPALSDKSSSLDGLKGEIEQVIEWYNSSSLLSTSEGIDVVTSKIKSNMIRVSTGYNNSNEWFGNYNAELTALEESLAGLSSENLAEPIEFTATFEDIFGKVTMPAIKTGGDPICNKILGPSSSGVLSFTPGRVPAAGVELANIARLDARNGGRATLLDVKVDGVSLGQDGEIVIKKGQKVHLTVGMPEEIEGVRTCKRTNFDGGSGWKNMVQQSNDPMVKKFDPSTYVDCREYGWDIVGTQTGAVTLSQTALFSIDGHHRYGTYKGMVRVRVKIVD
jgi:hypothetical protein